jgi:hypothetical protein
LWFIDALHLHEVAVAAGTHDLYLIPQSLQSIFLSGQCLLGKGLYCILPSVFVALDEINGSEGSPSDFLEGFEEFMEAELADAAGEVFPPEDELLVLAGVPQFEAVFAFLEADGGDVLYAPRPFFWRLVAK